jgi:hypothetical protein
MSNWITLDLVDGGTVNLRASAIWKLYDSKDPRGTAVVAGGPPVVVRESRTEVQEKIMLAEDP